MSTTCATVPLDDAYAWAASARGALTDAADALDGEGRTRLADETRGLADEMDDLANRVAQQIRVLR